MNVYGYECDYSLQCWHSTSNSVGFISDLVQIACCSHLGIVCQQMGVNIYGVREAINWFNHCQLWNLRIRKDQPGDSLIPNISLFLFFFQTATAVERYKWGYLYSCFHGKICYLTHVFLRCFTVHKSSQTDAFFSILMCVVFIFSSHAKKSWKKTIVIDIVQNKCSQL